MIRTRYVFVPYLFVAPCVALLAFIFGYPLVRIFEFSFRQIRGFTGPFVGFRNYQLVLNQPTFQHAVTNNAKLLLAVPVIIIISVLIAVILFERVRGWRVYRTLLFIPYILSVPIVAVVLKNVFQFNGPFNETARALGMNFLALDWLGDPSVAIWTIMIVVIWREVGFGIVLMLSRLLGLNEETLEAAQLDGANWWQRVVYVIVPQMRGIIEFYAVVNIIGMVAAVFAYVYMVTKGGPGTSTQIMELYIFNMLTRNALPGIASAVSVMLFIAFVIMIMILFFLLRRFAQQGTGMSGLASQLDGRLRIEEPRGRDWGTRFTHAILLVAVFTALFPSYFMFTTSFKTNEEYRFNKIGLPREFILEQYGEAIFQNEFIRWMLNSSTFALGSVALSSVVSALAAFAIARMQFRGQNILLALSTSLMVIPPVVLVVPLFLVFVQLELISTYHGTILIYAGLITPFSIYLLVSFFRTLPTEILEAALIDGASPFGVLWRVVIPLSAPALVTLLIVNTLYVWNDLLIALLFLQDDNKRTLMVGISVFQGRYNHQVPLSMAGMVMASLPMLILYILFQRFFISGLASGALKG